MSYKMISGRPLAQEIKRLLDQGTIAATTSLTHPSPVDGVRRVHDARKHIKKARALLQMVRLSLGERYVEADDQLRIANRALGPLADARRMLDTLAATRRERIVQLPMRSFVSMRQSLESRTTTIEQGAMVEDVRGRTVRLLNSFRQEITSTERLNTDRAAIVAEIRRSHSASRNARRRAIRQPSVDSFHDWRRRVKREWHLLRLVSDLTGDRLNDERHQLAALDECLGELHDVDVLISALVVGSPPLSRLEMAQVIRPLRAHARDLRHLARRLSSVLDERPQQLIQRVRVLWGAVPRRRAAATVHRWPHSA
jgi:CHAD domain-containing protein